jgi:hypothetical protein
MIKYRSQGVAEEISETQETVLAKLIKLGLDLQNLSGWV